MLSLTSLHISYVILGTVIIMVSLYGAYQFVEFDVMIFFWIIAFALGYSIILYGIKELCRRIL
jgi:predicted phage tail protein